MKELYVCARNNVAEITSNYNVTHVLSLLDHGKKPFLHPLKPVVWKMVHFEDTFIKNYDRSPTYEQVADCLEWSSKLPENSVLLVHCEAGVSRSTAMALAILVQKNGVDKLDECVQYLKKIRPQACPNPLVSEYADAFLNCGGKLESAANKLSDAYMFSFLNRKKQQ
jgi:predicted protein tyrosine phosphatase